MEVTSQYKTVAVSFWIIVLLMIGGLYVTYAFADEGITEATEGMWEWFSNLLQANVDDSPLEEKDKFNEAIESGTNAGQQGVVLWWAFHEAMVDIIFAGTSEADLPVDKGTLTIIMMFVTSAIILGIMWKLFKDSFKIGLIVLVVIVALAYIGLSISV